MRVRIAYDTREPTGQVGARWPITVLLPALLLAGFWLLMVASIREKSLTYDEGIHLAGGYSYWAFDDYRINPENGNLPQRLMALPALLGGSRFPSTDQAAWHRSNGWALSDQFLHDLGNDLTGMLVRGRACVALLAVALGLVVYLWSSRLFGPAGGVISLALFVLNPTVLANGPLMTSDMAGAAFFLASLWCLWIVLHRASPLTVLASGLVMGGLFASKMSGPLMVAVGLVLAVIRLVRAQDLEVSLGRRAWRFRARAKQAVVFAVVAIAHVLLVGLVIWGAYGFRYRMMRDAQEGRDQPYRPAVMEPAGMAWPLRVASDRHLLPEAYIYGQQYVIKAAQARLAFLNGRVDWEGWRSYFPYTFLVKTPLAAFVVVVLAVAAWWAGRRSPVRDARPPAKRGAASGAGWYQTAPLWTFLIIYWLIAITSHLNIGHRHLLPVYAPMFVMAGSSVYWLDRGRRAMAAVLLVVLALLAVETLGRFPNYLAYFNQIVGGPRNGYRHLVDSSLDWGQDLPALKTYLRARGLEAGGTRLYLSYFGRARPESYGIHAERLDMPPPANLPGEAVEQRYRAGVYCMSATHLQPVVLTPAGPWNREYEDLYQQARAAVRGMAVTADEAAGLTRPLEVPDGDWLRGIAFLNKLTSARFRAYLRQREPDEQVNHSILIYHVTDEQARQALDGPMPEDGPSLLQKAMRDE